MHSALKRPLMLSMRALSSASPTDPIEGRISSRARRSVSRIDVCWPVEYGLRPGIAVMDQFAGDGGVALSTSFPQRHPAQART